MVFPELLGPTKNVNGFMGGFPVSARDLKFQICNAFITQFLV